MPLLRIVQSFAQTIKNFGSDRSGNFGVIAALTMLPCVMIMGGAFDIFRITGARMMLQGAADSAALSSASLNNFTDVDSVAEEYVEAVLPSNAIWDNVVVDVVETNVTSSSRDIKLNASATVPSVFLGLVGIDSTTIQVTSSASQKATKFEISMVLDISSSMSGAKLTKLKQAAKDFVENVLDTDSPVPLVSINLVPYGGTVNIGSLFDTYVTTEVASIVDPNETQYKIGSSVEDGAFRFTDGLNCIEHRQEDFDDGALAENSRAQVPHFYVWSKNNPWCPTIESVVVPNTKDRDELHTRIDNLTLSDGTGSDIGLLWGTKFLSPEWRGKIGGEFTDRPADYDDEDTTKIVVFMTDGGITWQGRPLEHIAGLEKAKNGTMQKIRNTGSYSQTSASDTAYGRLKNLCEDLEDNGVKVFTIGFQIKSTSSAAKQMEDCAVNGGNYYLVETLDIISAFEAISSSISNLKVTG